jgi:hypothetical protein
MGGGLSELPRNKCLKSNLSAKGRWQGWFQFFLISYPLQFLILRLDGGIRAPFFKGPVELWRFLFAVRLPDATQIRRRTAFAFAVDVTI